jgi:uncharacterized membrane protein (DUF485 family)
MPAHKLILEKARSAGEWLLEWDVGHLRLHDPGGLRLFELPSGQVHRFVDLDELDSSKISFITPAGVLTFSRNKDAARDLRGLVIECIRSDGDFRELQKRTARFVAPLGIIVFLVCGGVLGLYAWWSSWAPDPPKGSWIYSVLWLAYPILLVAMAGMLAGPIAVYKSWRRFIQMRRIEDSPVPDGPVQFSEPVAAQAPAQVAATPPRVPPPIPPPFPSAKPIANPWKRRLIAFAGFVVFAIVGMARSNSVAPSAGNDMSPAVFSRLIVFTPMAFYAGIYCLRHGVRWSKNVTIRGMPAKIAAALIFGVAALMFLAVMFPSEAAQLMDTLDKATSSAPQHGGTG